MKGMGPGGGGATRKRTPSNVLDVEYYIHVPRKGGRVKRGAQGGRERDLDRGGGNGVTRERNPSDVPLVECCILR